MPRMRRLFGVVGAIALALICTIAGTNLFFLDNLRENTLQTAETNLARYSLTLAENADRSIKSADLVLSSVADYVGRKGAIDGDSYRAAVSDRETHTLLKEKIAGLPQIDAVTMIDAQGKLLNFSRFWPIPDRERVRPRLFQGAQIGRLAAKLHQHARAESRQRHLEYLHRAAPERCQGRVHGAAARGAIRPKSGKFLRLDVARIGFDDFAGSRRWNRARTFPPNRRDRPGLIGRRPARARRGRHHARDQPQGRAHALAGRAHATELSRLDRRFADRKQRTEELVQPGHASHRDVADQRSRGLGRRLHDRPLVEPA